WCVFLLYAFPGYMSYDSVFQLLEARSGRYSNGHPPLMAALWATVELFVSGPLGMLLLQSGCFLAGTFLIAQRTVSARSAALCAVGLLWFAPIGSVLAVIWKDSQMCAFLVLGTAFLLSSRRSVRMAGLGVLVLATGMRHNALTITLPLVTLLFVWDPAHRGLRRYALALVAWLAITLTARTAANALTSTRLDLWHQSIALFDLIGTRHFLPPASDTELQLALAGTPLAVESGLQAAAAIDDRAGFFDGIYQARARMFRPTLTESERAAVTSAWQATVLGHPVAFLRYRARAALEILELSAAPPPRIYRSFTDHQDPARNAERLQHDASTSAVQRWLQKRMSFVFRLSVSRVWAACLLTLLLVPLCLRHRAALAILLSGLTGELALMLVSPAADSRYSVWLAVAAGLGLCLQVGRRAGGKPALPGNGLDVPPPTAPGAAS
ncbi:MAG TPA: hypothetical protein PKU97_06190, partial [Kofleriaceae bacterium]|nr:hypothetical protein [Kofleriaceae bacterium]